VPSDADVTTSLVRRFYDRLWNAWDDLAVDETLAPDFVFRGSLGEQTTGRDGWRAYRDQVRRAAPDFSNEIVDLVAVADLAAARLLYSGTHRARCWASRRPNAPSPIRAPRSSRLPTGCSVRHGCSVTSTDCADSSADPRNSSITEHPP